VVAVSLKKYEGELTRISPASAAPGSQWGQGQTSIVRFPIEITVSGPSDGLMPGMTANAEIQCEVARDVLWVPNDAIFEKEDEKGKSFVSVVTGEKPKDESFMPAAKGEKKGELVTEDREVTLGLANNSRTEIKSGLEEGEEIELGKAAIPERKIIDISMESKEEDEEE
jgi:multidrug efflux pump subunit AcrA (membrane-fusion protein)